MIDTDRLLLDLDVGLTIRIKDPIDSGRILRAESRDRLFAWCDTNCQGRFWVGMGFGRFELKDDAVLFELSWGS
jgi:hypothetical protein